ncbi:MAG: nitroreductase family protein [Eubacteriaceae bacterium]|nr:nitroreductase family protein [Eubacteriaceae bacterium]
MEFFDVLNKRYSCRSFSPDQVEKIKLEAILESARIAPTAGNRQPVRIKVLDNEQLLSKAEETTRCRYGSQLMLLVCYDTSLHWVHPASGQDSGFTDSSIIGSYMMLTAESLGLNTLWVLAFDAAKAKEAFELGDNIVPAFYIVVGYPGPGAAPNQRHSERISMEQLLI